MMTELADLLRTSGVMTLRELGLEERVAAGQADIRLDALQMDSLAAMEFCIALESRWGFAVAPDELSGIGTLRQLADLIEGARGH